ncbi:MAG: hypothetical protein HY282_05950 [Nitrospirae bacterium]|nr:hypothetical protein [Candidatus Manganitrophaceae bacterium]
MSSRRNSPNPRVAAILLRALGVWVILMAAESLHGAARTLFLAPRIGDFRARQIAVFTGSIIILAIVTRSIRWIAPTSTRDRLSVGFLWLGLTLAFEMLFGRFVIGAPWERIASDYNLAEGGLLPIGLLVLALSPLIAEKMRGLK